MIFIDGIKIEYAAADMLPKAKAELQSEIDAAEALLANEDYTEGVEDFKAACEEKEFSEKLERKKTIGFSN